MGNPEAPEVINTIDYLGESAVAFLFTPDDTRDRPSFHGSKIGMPLYGEEEIRRVVDSGALDN